MKYSTSLLFSLFLILILVTVVQAQPGLPGAPSQAPIDGGLGLLAAAGGVYAIKKLRDKEKNKK
ncbi:MAG: PID-CTERM protein-sorting domain-containing protein [Balneola sp.]